MFALFTAAGAAAAVYFLDPESGARRRAMLRDKLARLRNEFGDVREVAGGRMEHMGNVAKGVAHETGVAGAIHGAHGSHESHENRSNGAPSGPHSAHQEQPASRIA